MKAETRERIIWIKWRMANWDFQDPDLPLRIINELDAILKAEEQADG